MTTLEKIDGLWSRIGIPQVDQWIQELADAFGGEMPGTDKKVLMIGPGGGVKAAYKGIEPTGRWVAGRFVRKEVIDEVTRMLEKEGMRKAVREVTKPAFKNLQKDVIKRAEFNVAVKEAEKLITKSTPLKEKVFNFLKSKWGVIGVGGSLIYIMQTNMWAEWAAADNISQGIGMAAMKLTDIQSRLSLVEDPSERLKLENQLAIYADEMEETLSAAEAFSEASQNNPLIALLAPTFHESVKVARTNFDLAVMGLSVPPTVYGRTLEEEEAAGEARAIGYERGKLAERDRQLLAPGGDYGTAYRSAFNAWLNRTGRSHRAMNIEKAMGERELIWDFERSPEFMDIAKLQAESRATWEAGMAAPRGFKAVAPPGGGGPGQEVSIGEKVEATVTRAPDTRQSKYDKRMSRKKVPKNIFEAKPYGQ